MSKQVDRKDEPVRLAAYRYRHEAELAAGFLSDAGIPFRLQADDAGGADLGLSVLRPAILWVRAVDAEAARDLVALEEEEAQPPPMGLAAPPRSSPERRASRLTILERAVSGAIAAALLAGAPNLPPAPFRESWVMLCFVSGFVFLGAAVLGWAPGPLGGLIRVLSGSPPR